MKRAVSYIKASVVVPDFDVRYSKVWRVLGVPDDEVQLDGGVERTGPHVALFGGLSRQEKIMSTTFSGKVVGRLLINLSITKNNHNNHPCN